MSSLRSYNSSPSLNILQWNVRSLPARITSLQNLLAHYKCSIAILSESWLLPSRAFNIPQFNFFRCDRPNGYAGSAIAIHSSIKSRRITLDPVTKNRFTEKKNEHC
jgi:exonuclease III